MRLVAVGLERFGLISGFKALRLRWAICSECLEDGCYVCLWLVVGFHCRSLRIVNEGQQLRLIIDQVRRGGKETGRTVLVRLSRERR